ncbi:Mitochondrial copper homeostasis protein [Entomortierella chlamydospora]|uniref:Mitochondrial copper homeostasis protein n=1 Tax=Entomortierella chlamydospora TaxID=101097 RepID=A0A9P6MUX6_9FUNG|nr:Mitochondrial copper homeostasis protein [Entomortierella chlamydospora]KAG0013649.1 Mitochondrial copper homeostasis protein [Entomortierella chlamydospora]
MSTETNARPRSGNNTTITSTSLNQDTKAGTDANGSSTPRGPRRRHEHIRTSDEELKEFNKNYYAKAQSRYMDPCQAQTKASMKCMDENNYEKRRCTRFFKDYSDCKKKWMETLREDRRKKNLGIVDDDESSEIKKE